MRYGHFYAVDQYELKESNWFRRPGQKQMWHTPCNSTVCKARYGPKWVCVGCYCEPPEEIMDVIWLSGAYKGWDEQEPIGYTLQSPFYYGFGGPNYNSFYSMISCECTGSNSNFYMSFYDPGKVITFNGF